MSENRKFQASKIRPRRLTDREAMWLRYGQAEAIRDDALQAKLLGNAIQRGEVEKPSIQVLLLSIEESDLGNAVLWASRRCSRLRLRGRR